MRNILLSLRSCAKRKEIYNVSGENKAKHIFKNIYIKLFTCVLNKTLESNCLAKIGTLL